jgi:hypothetical protein
VCEYLVTDEPVGVRIGLAPSGASYGTLDNPDSLLRGARRLVEEGKCTAIAVVCRFPDDEVHADINACTRAQFLYFFGFLVHGLKHFIRMLIVCCSDEKTVLPKLTYVVACVCVYAYASQLNEYAGLINVHLEGRVCIHNVYIIYMHMCMHTFTVGEDAELPNTHIAGTAYTHMYAYMYALAFTYTCYTYMHTHTRIYVYIYIYIYIHGLYVIYNAYVGSRMKMPS